MGLGAIGAALGGSSVLGPIAASFGGSAISSAFNAQMAGDQRTAQEDMFRRRYQIMVGDLKKAGLNPMLAYMKDAGTPPTTSPAHASGDLGQVISQARSSSAQSQLMKIQEVQAASQADLTAAQADKTRAETMNVEKHGRLLDAQAYDHSAGGMLKDTEAGRIKATLQSVISKANSDEEAARLLLPHLRNMAESEKSAFKRNIAPFIHDMESLSRTGANVSNMLNPLRILDYLNRWDRDNPATGPSGEREPRSRGRSGGYGYGRSNLPPGGSRY